LRQKKQFVHSQTKPVRSFQRKLVFGLERDRTGFGEKVRSSLHLDRPDIDIAIVHCYNDYGHDHSHYYWSLNMTATISKSKLKANMLEIFRHLEASGEELIVTDRDQPVLKIIPIKQKASAAEVFGDLQGQVTYLEDINTPTLSEWEEA
jgi:antitoxin (DNA-binding transcriptional repressor) of toxin-antitoxin stability system